MLNRHRAVVLALLVGFTLPAAAQAPAVQDPAVAALAERYVNLGGVQEMIDDLLSADTLGAQFAASLPPELQPSAQQQAEIGALMADRLGSLRGDMQTEMLSAAVTMFTAEELQALIAFNESPIGESIMKKMPAYTQQTMMALVPRMSGVIQDLAPELAEIMSRP